MATIRIRNIDEVLYTTLQKGADINGWTVEDQARFLLEQSFRDPADDLKNNETPDA